MNRRNKGKKGEDIAAEYLVANGAFISERNFYFKGGELDIIAYDNYFNERYLCFIEVKYREKEDMGLPEEAVDHKKQQNIIKGAKSYMNYKKIAYNTPVRFDVIAILGDEVKWIKNAFTM